MQTFRKLKKMEADLYAGDAIQFYNDNLIDGNMHLVTAIKKKLIFTNTTPRQYEDWVRQSN